MKVIGAGLPETGTLALKMALEVLGLGPCYHMINVVASPAQVALWERVLEGERPWEEIFEGFNSTVDWPGGYYYRELMRVFPDAKLVLSVREPEDWERSMRDTVWAASHGESSLRMLSSAQARVSPEWQDFLKMVDRLLWEGQGTFASGHAEPEDLINAMRRHDDDVKRTVAPERLLVWNTTEGWEPLCEFLALPIPPVPFPHVNDAAEFYDGIIDGARLEQAIVQREIGEDRLRQVLSDSSHELRTPLTAIRGYAELFRMGASGDTAGTEKAMLRIEEEAKRMATLVDDLLTLARLEEKPKVVRKTVDLAVLVTKAAADARAIAPDRLIDVDVPASARVSGNPDQLMQVLANLTRNALTHTPPGTPVEITVEQDEDSVAIVVLDHGGGIPEESLGRLFERFWQADKESMQPKTGAGLGLAIVSDIVASHGGAVDAGNAPKGGARFTVRLPKGDS